MRLLGVVALSSVSIVGCSNCAGKQAAKVAPVQPPDTSKIIKVIGRWSIASACPVGEHIVLTAAHVGDPRPFDQLPGYVPLVWQQKGRGGVMNIARTPHPEWPRGKPEVQMERDIAAFITEGEALEFYPIAQAPPAPGETVWLSGYDWRTRKNAFADRVWTAKVLRLVAGLLVFDPAGEPGTSGSCILNAGGEVVGINVGGKYVGSSLTGKLGFGGEPEEVGFGWVVIR